MSRLGINTGSSNDGTGDSLRSAMVKLIVTFKNSTIPLGMEMI